MMNSDLYPLLALYPICHGRGNQNTTTLYEEVKSMSYQHLDLTLEEATELEMMLVKQFHEWDGTEGQEKADYAMSILEKMNYRHIPE